MNGEPSPLLLAGPTAVGKSEIALRLAEKLRGEIVSVDSMQVYRGLDIGTAKASLAQRARVPHHLLDVVAVNQPFDVAHYLTLASAAIGEIQSRGAVPILCGGTGLYFKALTDGIGSAPAGNVALRKELENTPLDELLQELLTADPLTFARIDRKNPRRVARAVEVIRLTGKPFSSQRSDWRPRTNLPFFCLTRAPEDLRARIDKRVDDMFQAGLIEETRRAMQEGLGTNPTALQAIGYRQVVDHLHGKLSLPATVELVKVRTRQYAKRQLTWFRRQAIARWLTLEPVTDAAAVANQLAASFAKQ